MRAPMNDFITGYGCLFTLEFHTVAVAVTSFNALDVQQRSIVGGKSHFSLAIRTDYVS